MLGSLAVAVLVAWLGFRLAAAWSAGRRVLVGLLTRRSEIAAGRWPPLIPSVGA